MSKKVEESKGKYIFIALVVSVILFSYYSNYQQQEQYKIEQQTIKKENAERKEIAEKESNQAKADADKEFAYENDTDVWCSDIYNLNLIIDKGQPEVSFPGYQQEIRRLYNEIMNYDRNKIPEGSFSSYEQWKREVSSLLAKI